MDANGGWTNNSLYAATPLPGEACADVRCDGGAICEVSDDGVPHCACNIDCTDVPQRPVCASDLRMYPSECAMRAHSCNSQLELRLRPLQLCQGYNDKCIYLDNTEKVIVIFQLLV